MKRTLLTVLLCLTVGAGGMWVASNFRVKFESVGVTEPPPPPTTAAKPDAAPPVTSAPPDKLPAHLLPQQPTPGIRLAGNTADPVPAAPATGAAVAAAAEDTLKAVAAKRKAEVEKSSILITSMVDDAGGGSKLNWPPAATIDSIRLRTRTLGVTFSMSDKTEYVRNGGKVRLVVFNGETRVDDSAEATVDVSTGIGNVTLDLSDATKFPTGKKFTIKAERAHNETEFSAIRTGFADRTGTFERWEVIPAAGPKAAIARVFNGRFAKEQGFKQGTAFDLFPTYARVVLDKTPVGARYDFFLYDATVEGKKFVATAKVVSSKSVDPDGTEFTLAWDTPAPAGSGMLLVRENFEGGHSYLDAAVTVLDLPSSALPALSLDGGQIVADGVNTTVTKGVCLTGAEKMNMTVAMPAAPQGKVKEFGTLLVYLNKPDGLFPTPLLSKTDKDLSDSVSFNEIKFPNDGEHVITAAFEVGGVICDKPLVFTVKVRRGGLSVVRVSPTDFANATDHRIRVTFSPDNTLNGGTLKGNFTLKNSAGGDAQAISGDPQYDNATNTVTLQILPTLPPGVYTLEVNGKGTAATETPTKSLAKPGIQDVYGNPLGGVFGGEGQNALFSILQPAEGNQPSQSAGVVGGGAPYVTYPEYTKFRQLTDGFNPSDRVETRVVRLYYSRDAHHVAEVVNRNARSWNSMSVDVRRRAADLSRDTANAATDSRKRLEGDSVQSATETRTAEGRLRDLQAKLTAARAEAATASTQLGQKQQQQEQFLRTAGRDQTGVGVRRDTDSSTDAAQSRLDRLTAEVTQAEAVVTTAKQNPAARPSDLDTPLQTARQTLDASQQAFRVEFADRRAAAEQTTTVRNAAADVATLEAARRRPGLSPEQLARLDADLSAAIQKRDDAIQTEVLRADANGVLRTKLTKAQTDQLEVERLVNARDALTALPTIRTAQADARRDLDRAKVVARGRAETDTGTDASLDTARQLATDIRTLNTVLANSRAVQQSLEAEIANATGEVQAKRAKEVELNLRVRESEQQELRGRETQFRREVAAGKADPNTFAPGKPESVDPVEQCSVSVIGEGLIQIRGPVKGLNVIRTMINQLDAPTGQVRVGVHTFQVNGEKADRMDRVSANIQRYLEHSKFLTTQSAQMLRKAVTLVASRKAQEAALTVAPGCSKAEMEAKYLHCFFGKDFIDELRQLDSEFLRSGNKLLSLHSMDSTSLSAALFLLALAKNDIRHEILAEWQAQLQTKLPEAEMTFYTAGLVCAERCEAHHDRKFCVLAQNAKFASFLGFFDAEVQGADTMTPVQREFVRLAQIFKTRLVTEMELKQRVMERTLLEDRLGDYIKESKEAKAREDEAKVELVKFQNSLQEAIVKVSTAFGDLQEQLDDVDGDFKQNEVLVSAVFKQCEGNYESSKETPRIDYSGASRELSQWKNKDKDREYVFRESKYDWMASGMLRTADYLSQFYYLSRSNYKAFEDAENVLREAAKARKFTYEQIVTLQKSLDSVFAVIRAEIVGARLVIVYISTELKKNQPDLITVLSKYARFRDDIQSKLRAGKRLKKSADELFGERMNPAFRSLQEAVVKQQAAQRRATLARRPLDEKKMLDMLVDEMEDKYIELLDGTRAHTANVDNYLKALATALDDDFNTQFYQPAFRRIRTTTAASRDVALGQIESTTVLTNNRMLGKVSPAASMEFDLPRRNILVKEAFDGAKKAVQDYGALLNDPIFLDMVKMYGGLPPSAQFGGAGGGLSSVRNVLPGLPSSADEMLMAQAGSPRRDFGTNLSSLVPDPAIYKFETGTGYEIRPVISPDGQAVVFAFDYMYTTDVREPVRADEKHLGRVKRHFVHSDVQLGNYELREVSKYWVTLKASRTGQGVPLLQDIPIAGALFRPAPSASSSLQQNLIYSQAAIFPTLYDLMGLRYAPAVADIDPEHTKNDEFVVRGRRDYLRQFIFDYGASRVDDALRIMYGERRPDLYRSQHSIPWVHPNGYQGPGLRQRDAELQEGYEPVKSYPPTRFAPGMHAPTPTDRDPYGADPYGVPGRPLPPTGYGPPPLSAKPPTNGYGAMQEYNAKSYGTTVTPAPTARPPAATFNELPPPRLASPTVSPPAPRPTTPAPVPVPARPTAGPLEPVPLNGRVGVNTNPYTPR